MNNGWALAGLAIVQFTSIVTLVITLRVKRTSESTYKSVNGVDVANDEPKLIDQVRHQGREIRHLKAMNEWKVGVLKQVAEQVGLDVPPLPVDDEDEERAA